MFDNDCNLILNSYAKKHSMLGFPITIEIDTVNGKEKMETNYYYVILFDQNKQKQYEILSYGVDRISSPLPLVDLSPVKSQFPTHVQENWNKVARRPTGDIQLLIGQNQAGIHPSDHSISSNLKVQKSLFGSGYLVTGSSPLIPTPKVTWDPIVNTIRLCSTSTLQTVAKSVNKISIRPQPNSDFFTTEGMGVTAPRRCKSCKGCKECDHLTSLLSKQQ